MGARWRTTVTAVAVGLLATTPAAHADSGWQRVAAPPAGLEYLLDDVSAVAPDLAWAVGLTETGGGLFLLRWDGTRWRHETDLPPTASPALRAVQARGGAVLAAGQDLVGGLTRPLLLARGDDGGWTKAVGTAPNGEHARLHDVAFGTGGTAWAVGREGSGLVERPVAHRWTGAALERFPLPAGETYARAEAVTSAPDGSVWAVGTSGGLAGAASRGLSWRWAGGAWRAVPVPSAGAHQVELTDVVTAAGGLWAVGRADTRPLVLSWSGGAWQEAPLPTTAAGTRINAASDDGHGGLWLAGEVRQGRDAEPFFAHRRAGAWSTSSPSGLAGSALRGIAHVPGTATMWAAGRYFRTGDYCSGCRATLAVHG